MTVWVQHEGQCRVGMRAGEVQLDVTADIGAGITTINPTDARSMGRALIEAADLCDGKIEREFPYFKSESGGIGHGSRWIFKGCVPEGYVEQAASGLTGLAAALGRLNGAGRYMVFGLPWTTDRRTVIDVEETRTYRPKVGERS